MFRQYKDVLTVKEVCEALGIGRNTAYTLLRTGTLRSVRIGKSIRIPKKYLTEYVTKQ